MIYWGSAAVGAKQGYFLSFLLFCGRSGVSYMLPGGEVLFKACYSSARAAFAKGNRKRGGESRRVDDDGAICLEFRFVLLCIELRSGLGGGAGDRLAWVDLCEGR